MALKVLIVDDSAVMRSMVQKTIKMSGVPVSKIFHAANGQEGLDVLDAERIDIVFVDINMPVMGGLEMIDNIIKNPDTFDMSIVVVSTETSQTRINDIQKMGLKFLHKPFTPEKVLAIITDLLGEMPSRINVIEDQLQKVTKNVLETMAFICARDNVETIEDTSETQSASVSFKGPFSGSFVLTITESALLEIAENMLGLDEDENLTHQLKSDALCELVNVVSGNLLAELAGPNPVFDLESSKIVDGGHELSGNLIKTRLGLDNGWAELSLVIDEGEFTNQATVPATVVGDEDSF